MRLKSINQIIPRQKMHTVGLLYWRYFVNDSCRCYGNKSDERLKSITLFAAQIDFKDPGELSLFVDQSQITYLEDIMWEKGYLGWFANGRRI